MFCIFGLFVYCYFIFQKDGTEIQAFVAECQGQIVGLSVIRREEVMIYLNNSICIFLFYINLLCQLIHDINNWYTNCIFIFF